MTNTAINLNFAITDATNPEKLRQILAVFKEANLLENATVASSVVAPVAPTLVSPATEDTPEVAAPSPNIKAEQAAAPKRAPRATAQEMTLRTQYEVDHGTTNWRDLIKRQEIMSSLGHDIYSKPVKAQKDTGSESSTSPREPLPDINLTEAPKQNASEEIGTAKFDNPIIYTINKSYLTHNSELDEKLLAILKEAFSTPPIPVEIIFQSENLNSNESFKRPPLEVTELIDYIESPLGLILSQFHYQLDTGVGATVLLNKFQKIKDNIFEEYSKFDDAYKVAMPAPPKP